MFYLLLADPVGQSAVAILISAVKPFVVRKKPAVASNVQRQNQIAPSNVARPTDGACNTPTTSSTGPARRNKCQSIVPRSDNLNSFPW